MDNNTNNRILDKKLDYGNSDRNNFVCESEITVTITLNEYRALVTTQATCNEKVDAAEKDRYERNTRCEKLEKENAQLKAEMYELQKKLSETTDVVEVCNAEGCNVIAEA